MCISIIPDINITLKLFYNMYGDDIRTLKVYSTQGNPLFTRTEEQGKTWMNTSITAFILGSQKVSKIFYRRKFSNNTKLSKNINIYILTLGISSPVQKNSIFTRFFTSISHFLFIFFLFFFCNFPLLFFVQSVCYFYYSFSFLQT